ncbi:hypothetical protein [Microbacterium sp. A1-JK]|uniref:hypothetical protein n=1 Tax=Microbacterium sp. A1-JK TaxID=3177516 RepID=UPI003886FEE5
MATIAFPRRASVAVRRAHASPGPSLRDAINRMLYGQTTVTCEECGTPLRPHRAVWRGAHPYCSAEHEAADSF